MHAGESDLRLYEVSDLKTYLYMRGLGPDFVSAVGLTKGVNCWISLTLAGIQLYVLLSSYLCFFSFLYLDLYMYVLGDDTSKRWGPFMRVKHLFVLIHIRNKGEVGTVKYI